MILAETREAAFQGAKLVRVTYENEETPIIGIDDAIRNAKEQGHYDKLFVFHPKSSEALAPSPSSSQAQPHSQEANRKRHTLSGQFTFPSQVHFAIEPHVTLCVPKEGGMDVYSATQWMDQIQAAIAQMLGAPNNT